LLLDKENLSLFVLAAPLLSNEHNALLQLDSIEREEPSGANDSLDSGMKLPLFSMLAIEGGTGCMCAVQGTSIVAIAGKERGGNEWKVHLVDADTLLLLNSAPLLHSFVPGSPISCVALNAQTIDDGTVRLSVALLLSDAQVMWAQACISSCGMAMPLTRLSAHTTSAVFKLGNSVVEAPLMGAGNTSLLLEDDGRARVKQVVSNSQMHAALLDGNLLLAWRVR
jgi:hypothetical protein